jgi:hypothetical protein
LLPWTPSIERSVSVPIEESPVTVPDAMSTLTLPVER